jgi:hypothetical protein
MVWLLLVLNIAIVFLSLRKRVLPFSILSLIFIVLVVGQAIQIHSDLQRTSTVSYAFSTISVRGFSHALWFVTVVSLILLAMTVVARGYRTGSQPKPLWQFNPPTSFYVLMVGLLSAIGGILIFGVVGLSAFLSQSRPGDIPGATLFITLLSLGIFPLYLKILYPGKIRAGDVICFLISIVLSAGFSRLHVIFYVLVLVLVLYYGRRWCDRPFNLRITLRFTAFGTFLFAFFFVAGAIRDAENVVHGSIGDLVRFNLDHPETSLLSVQVIYRVGIEGMAGISGAMSDALDEPGIVRHDYGLSSAMGGLDQVLPAALKTQAHDFINFVEAMYWYQKPIGNVPAGLEIAFVSFGWFGVIVYPVLFFLLYWSIPIATLTHRVSPPVRLMSFMYFGCGIFFVRGSWAELEAFLMAFTVIILLLWPLLSLYMVREPLAEPVPVGEPVPET